MSLYSLEDGSNYFPDSTWQHSMQLPDDFAEKLMEFEILAQFEQSCDIQIIQQLNELYRIGIEYYSIFEEKKAKHLLRKLIALLTNPNAIDVLEQKQMVVKTAHIDSRKYKRTLKEELNKFNAQSKLMVIGIIEGKNKRIENSNDKIRKHLSKQQKTLEERIRLRSRQKTVQN